MGSNRLLIILVALGVVGLLWQGLPGGGIEAHRNESGFAPVVMPEGAPTTAVIVFTAPNCPSEQARHAQELAAELAELGIPVHRTSRYTAQVDRVDRDQRAALRRTQTILEGDSPVVFVRGVGMNAPSVDAVVAQYRQHGWDRDD